MGNIKKFEDFFDKMRGLLDNAKKQGHIIVRVEDIENTFPELKESEDEQIRKKLISFVENWDKGGIVSKYTSNANDIKQILAWLEKQGEKPQGKSALEAIKEEKVDNANKVEPKDYSSIDPHFFKTIDKVEPKFHEGDWIVQGYNILKIKCVGNTHYCFETVGGYVDDMLISEIDFQFHLWTIQDAKDGDVLFHSDSASNGIFIFKEIIDKGFAKEVICYCDYDSEDHFCLGEHHTCCWTDAKILYPATKEQRDTLMKAITNAGYIFNFESKELRKIEKPIEWSYEDEANLNNIIWLCNNCIKGTETTWIPSQATKIKHLIETIKEEGLAQQNPAWSEEDEQIILSIEQAMNCASLLNIAPEKMDKIRAWLKSLKDRCTWKPSSLQMECLHDAIKHYHTNGYPASKLKELYEQMSKIYKL